MFIYFFYWISSLLQLLQLYMYIILVFYFPKNNTYAASNHFQDFSFEMFIAKGNYIHLQHVERLKLSGVVLNHKI